MSKSQKFITTITCDHCKKQEQTHISSNWFALISWDGVISLAPLDKDAEQGTAIIIGTDLQFCSKECFISFMSSKYDELIKGE